MIEKVKVKSFKSLHDIEVSLGTFTVILGESSNGKSAFIESLQALAFNIVGNSHVTSGHNFSTVSAVLNDYEVAIERGEGVSIYRVTDFRTGNQEPFDKLNKMVPSEIKEILDLNQYNFAGQFDSPFLLKESGSKVAKVLGELTNVNVLLEAISNGNKESKSLSVQLKSKQSDLDKSKFELEKFYDLPSQINHLQEVEEILEIVNEEESKFTSLSTALKDLEDAVNVLEEVPEYPPVPDADGLTDEYSSLCELSDLLVELESSMELLSSVAILPEVPDLDGLEQSFRRWYDLEELMSDIDDQMTVYKIAQSDIQTNSGLVQEIDSQIQNLLVEAGTCPVCQQTVMSN